MANTIERISRNIVFVLVMISLADQLLELGIIDLTRPVFAWTILIMAMISIFIQVTNFLRDKKKNKA